MVEKFNIAAYCRISVDDELDKENTSIENQKAIITDYVQRNFPGSALDFYEDRDRSGYTFEQREGYQKMRPLLMNKYYDILIIKDFSRFSRRNSHGLVEIEDLRDAGLRIISIGENVDYPKDNDWLKIQFHFLMNEVPVTSTSSKVKRVIERRQTDGKWICAVPYGYVITNSKTMAFEIDEPAAEIVRLVFELYNDGWGYKKIANHLTDKNIPTPRMVARSRKEAKGEECKLKAKTEWSIITIQGIIENDFYIGTLRQGKYTRKKINGKDIKKDESEHIVFENHHEPIIDYRTFAIAREQMKKRSRDNYRGVKKYDNVYSGLLECGDCGSPMFSMSRPDLMPAYRCGTYHRRGKAGCTSHHIREDKLDEMVKIYLREIRDTSADMIKRLEKQIADESQTIKTSEDTVSLLEKELADAKEELKILARQKTREVMRNPEQESVIEETYEELMSECKSKVMGLENQIILTNNKRSTVVQVTRIARTAIDVFNDLVNKPKLDKKDLELIVERIYIYEDSIQIKLKSDIECMLQSGKLPEGQVVNFNPGIIDILSRQLVQAVKNRPDKVYDVNVISNGDPLEIYTSGGGEVIFKKYSPMGEMMSLAADFCAALSQSTKLCVAICDRDRCVAASKKDLVEKPLTAELEALVEKRCTFSGEGEIWGLSGIDKKLCGMHPIIASGDIIGCVCLFENDNCDKASDTELGLLRLAAEFLALRTE